MRIRDARAAELPELSELCLRSKAVWGYDLAFIEACRAELTLRPEELETTGIAVAEDGRGIAGVVQVAIEGEQAELLKLFVDPARIGGGIGRMLFDWAVAAARRSGASRLVIESDPGAAAFYRRMGARDAGLAPSGSVPGRMLPRLSCDLRDSTPPRPT